MTKSARVRLSTNPCAKWDARPIDPVFSMAKWDAGPLTTRGIGGRGERGREGTQYTFYTFGICWDIFD